VLIAWKSGDFGNEYREEKHNNGGKNPSLDRYSTSFMSYRLLALLLMNNRCLRGISQYERLNFVIRKLSTRDICTRE
jgi:hypothetical protein